MAYHVSPEKYNSILKSHEELIQAYRELKEDKAALQNEYDSQFALNASLRQSLSRVEEDFKKSNDELARYRRIATEKDREVSNTNDYLKQKAHQMVVIEDARKQQTVEIASLHAQIDRITIDKQSLEAQISMFQSELDERKNTISRLESTLLEAERQRQLESDKTQKLQSEINRRERDLANCQELVSALTDAHQKSTERAKVLQYEVDSYRRQTDTRSSLDDRHSSSRQTDSRETDDIARARLELFNIKASAEAELQARQRAGASGAYHIHRDERDLRQYVKSLTHAIDRTQRAETQPQAKGESRPSPTTDKRQQTPTSSQARPSRLGQQLTRTFQTVL